MTQARRARRWPWWALALSLALVAAATLIAASTMLLERRLEGWLRAEGAARAEIGDVSLELLDGTLRIEGIEAADAAGSALRIERLSLDFAWRPLLGRRLVLSEVSASGVTAEVGRDAQGRWTVAFIAPQKALETAWPMEIARLTLEASALRHAPLELEIGSLQAAPAEAGDAAHVDLEGRLNGGALRLEGRLARKARTDVFDGRLALGGFPLRAAPGLAEALGLEAEAGTLDAEGELALELGAGPDLGLRHRGEATLRNVTGGLGDARRLYLQRLAWQGGAEARFRDEAATGLRLEGQVSATGTELRDAGRDLQLTLAELRWRGVVERAPGAGSLTLGSAAPAELRGLEIESLDGSLRLLRCARLAVEGLAREGRALRARLAHAEGLRLARVLADGDDPWQGEPLLTAASARAEGLALEAGTVSAERLALAEAIALVWRTPSGGWPRIEETARWLRARADRDLPAVRLDAIVTDDNSGLRFSDLGNDYRTTLALEALTIEQLDTTRPERPARWRMRGTAGTAATLRAEGDWRPAADPPSLDADARLDRLYAAQLTAYTSPWLGYALERGQLAARLELRLVSRALEASTRLVLRGVEAHIVDAERARALREALVIPLEATLNLLRDPEDRAAFTWALEWRGGENDDRLATALNRSLGRDLARAARRYVDETLAPQGRLIIEGGDGEPARGAARLTPVSFPPGSSTLDARGKAYLERIARLLRERPRLSIAVCGETRGERGAPSAGEDASALVSARGRAIREHLVRRHGISPGRLYLCQPRGADSGVEQAPAVRR